MAPLNRILQKNQTKYVRIFKLCITECYENPSKKKLISSPIPALFYAGGHFTLDTNACDVEVGCMPLQKQPDKTKKPVGHRSRSLTKVEKTYGTTQQEFFGNRMFGTSTGTLFQRV